MNLRQAKDELKYRAAEKIKSCMPDGLQIETAKIFDLMTKPPDADLGDFALPCFSWAKELRSAPNKIAEALADKLKAASADGLFESISVSGAYLNLKLKSGLLAKTVLTKVHSGAFFTSLAKAAQQDGVICTMVEFSQPIPTRSFM